MAKKVRKVCGLYASESPEHRVHGKRSTMVFADGTLFHTHGNTETTAAVVVEPGESAFLIDDTHGRWSEMVSIESTGDWEVQMMTDAECSQWTSDTTGQLD